MYQSITFWDATKYFLIKQHAMCQLCLVKIITKDEVNKVGDNLIYDFQLKKPHKNDYLPWHAKTKQKLNVKSIIKKKNHDINYCRQPYMHLKPHISQIFTENPNC